jgi:DNA-directed RNA polymerase specialized sigma subunit
MLDLTKATDNELALIAVHGDKESMVVLWERSYTTAKRIAGFFVKRYPWIDHDDLIQGITLATPKLIHRFDPEKGVSWSTYVYHSYYRAAQDYLRKLDPLGISYPQKMHYPEWSNISALGDHRSLADSVIHDGLTKLDRQYEAQYGRTKTED